MIELSKNILQKSLNQMEENSYHNLCIMEKSVVNPFAYVYLNDVDITKIFNAAYNKNAKYIYFTINDIKYVKFPISINLNSKADEIDRRKSVRSNTKYQINKHKAGEKSYLEYITLYDRGIMNRNTIEVYCNGYKIPDKNILITLYSGSIDLYIPVNYLNKFQEPQLSFILNKYTNKEPYYNAFSNSINSSLISMPFLDEENLDAIRVYKNGILVTDWFYDDENQAMNISRLGIEVGDEVEFTFRQHSIYHYSGIPINKVITFDKEYLRDKPIFADITETYINGIRQFPKEITNVSPRNISLNNFNDNDKVDYYLVYDPEYPEDKNHYIDDLTRFFNYKHEDASIILNGEYEGYLPNYIKNIDFPPEVIKVMNEDLHKTSSTFKEFLEKKSKDYIKQNPEYFKYLLKNLKTSSYDHYYDYNYIISHMRMSSADDIADLEYQTFSEPHVVFIFNNESPIDDNFFMLAIDGVITNIIGKDITYYNRNKVYLYLPMSLFNEETELVRILHFPIYNNGHKHAVITTGNTVEIKKWRKDSDAHYDLGYVQDISDLFIMKKLDNGYLADLNITRTQTDDRYIITINDYDENENYLVYNASFSMKQTYTLQENDINGTQPVKIPYDILVGGQYLPMTTFYAPIIIRNGKILSKDTDYKILSQFNNPSRNKAEIVFGMQCSVGDEIEIYHTECYYESIGGVDYINSEYGIIYFENLLVPFDSGYLDLYVDGQIVDPSNIEIISTNMIKVNNVPNLINVGIRSKLNIPLYVIKEYTDTFIANPSLWDEYLRDYWYDYNRIDTFYKEYNPEGTTTYSDPTISENKFDIMVELIARFFMAGLIPRLIDCNVYYDFSQCYFVRELLTDKHDYIEINCNKEQLAEAQDIDMMKFMKSYDEIVDAVSKVCDEDILDASIEIPDDSPLWKDIYPDELNQAYFN